ncbi:MAG: hypothetical protein NXH70_02170 [Hyphomonas sp.]|nr:hypothetical protein [Hyphomonas sp.]
MTTKQDIAIDILKGAVSAIEKTGWTKGAYARDHEGHSVGSDNQDAQCFCSLGAIEHSARACQEAYGDWDLVSKGTNLAHEKLATNIRRFPDYKTVGFRSTIAKYNDAEGVTQQMVVREFNNTIELIKLEAALA